MLKEVRDKDRVQRLSRCRQRSPLTAEGVGESQVEEASGGMLACTMETSIHLGYRRWEVVEPLWERSAPSGGSRGGLPFPQKLPTHAYYSICELSLVCYIHNPCG